MGTAYEVIAGRVTNPGATITALTADTGNSFTIRSFPETSRAQLEALFAEGATAGTVRVRSPRLHDNVQGIRYGYIASTPRDLLPPYAAQSLYPQDTLTFELSGGGAETDAAAFCAYYPDLPGVDARLATWEQVQPRIVNFLTVEVGVAGPTTAGDWSAGTAINATFDLLKANVDYAVLGYTSGTSVLAVALQGSDTGNLRAGGPGTTEVLETRMWYVDQSVKHATPHIPIINAANKASTLAAVAHTTTGGTITVDFTFAELSGS